MSLSIGDLKNKKRINKIAINSTVKKTILTFIKRTN